MDNGPQQDELTGNVLGFVFSDSTDWLHGGISHVVQVHSFRAMLKAARTVDLVPGEALIRRSCLASTTHRAPSPVS